MARRALVTGANRGIGRAIAARLKAGGLEVVLAGRDRSAIAEVAREIGAQGIELDVREEASVREAANVVGAVDVLVNNAGILDEGDDPLGDQVEAVVDTNLLGAWRVCRAFVPAMAANGWGRVVNVSSGAGSFDHGLWAAAPAYSVSKAALNALTLVLAQRLEGTGVKVNAVDPGTVGTRMAPYASRTPEQAAEHVAALALLPDDGPTGGFFHEGEPQPW